MAVANDEGRSQHIALSELLNKKASKSLRGSLVLIQSCIKQAHWSANQFEIVGQLTPRYDFLDP
jgi:hypothetical protein